MIGKRLFFYEGHTGGKVAQKINNPRYADRCMQEKQNFMQIMGSGRAFLLEMTHEKRMAAVFVRQMTVKYGYFLAD